MVLEYYIQNQVYLPCCANELNT